MTSPGRARSGLWTRREFLEIAGALGAVSVLAACSGSDPEPTARVGGAFAAPDELVSKNGLLEVTLRCAVATVPYGDGTRTAFTYNGVSPGPTLRVRGGDRLVITLVNDLDAPTNLHTHGLHVSPEGAGDNIFVSVEPGERRVYEYEIPRDHRSSLCWYHPHHHGAVAEQLAGGLFGAIIVEDHIDDLPLLAALPARVLMLHDPDVGRSPGSGVSMMDQMMGRQADRTLVNGVLTPKIAVAAGTIEHWRIVNASASRYHRLALSEGNLAVIATDGGRLDRVHEVDDLLLAPGERAEVLVYLAAATSLRDLGYDRGTTGMGGMMGGRNGTTAAQTLVTMHTNGPSTASQQWPPALTLAPPVAVDAATSERSFDLLMGMGGGGMGRGMGGGGGMMSFTINGAPFDPSRVDTAVEYGTVEDWLITNTTAMDHPFHLHAWPFQVIERSSGPSDLPGWKDTVNVPAGATVRIRVPFVDIRGRTVYHCHILDHEDLGMMGVVEVS